MLITSEYRKLNQQLHEDRLDYGVASLMLADQVFEIAKALGVNDLLDYGAGKGRLAVALLGKMNVVN